MDMNFTSDSNYNEVLQPVQILELEQPVSKKFDYQFVPISFNRITDPEWRRNNRCPLAGYAYMRSEVVRGVYAGDKYDLYHRYWCDNKFACGTSIRDLTKAFGYKGTKKPQDWLKQLFSEGAFEIHTIPVPGKPKPANIYILGHSVHGKEVWYYDN
jgi:hypothetical protein